MKKVLTYDIFDDWTSSDKFNYLRKCGKLIFLPRTEEISISKIKEDMVNKYKVCDFYENSKY